MPGGTSGDLGGTQGERMATYYEDSGLRARAHYFSSPARNFFQMLTFIVVVGAVAWVPGVRETLQHAFMASIPINSVILGVFAIGVIVVFVQVIDVGGAVA